MKLPSYFDIHTHLNFSAFDADREDAYRRAHDAGVHMINVGTQKDTSKSAVDFAQTHEGAYATIGLHPIHTDKSHHDKDELGPGGKDFISREEKFDSGFYKKLGQDPKVVAIGECGLDYFRAEESSREKQKEIFEQHIALARELKKPLMLHIRNARSNDSSPPERIFRAGVGQAYRDALEILKKYPGVKGNSHFFAGTWEEAKGFLDLGYTLSFTGVITFARNYDEVIRNAPLDMIMSETDAPYVSPIPQRGKRNEPLYVKEIVKKITEIHGEDYEKVRETLVKNAIRVFQIDGN